MQCSLFCHFRAEVVWSGSRSSPRVMFNEWFNDLVLIKLVKFSVESPVLDLRCASSSSSSCCCCCCRRSVDVVVVPPEPSILFFTLRWDFQISIQNSGCNLVDPPKPTYTESDSWECPTRSRNTDSMIQFFCHLDVSVFEHSAEF